MTHHDRIAQLRQLLAAEPNDAFLTYGLALELRAAGDAQAAVTMLEDLRKQQPDYTPLYYQLAMSYIESNEPERARAVIREGMTLTKATDSKTHHELRALLDDLD